MKKKYLIDFFFKQIIFFIFVIFSSFAYALTTPDEIYELAQEGNIKALTKLTNTIDTLDKNNETALCKAVYSHDYSAFHLLRTVGANPYQRCIKDLSRQEMDAFNAGYKSWFHQVKQGNIQPNWMKKQDSSAWLSSFKGYALEIGLVGIAAGAIAAGGGGGGSSNNSSGNSNTSKQTSVDCNGHGNKNTDGECQCNDGYEGENCSSEKDCGSEYSALCDAGYHQNTTASCKSGETTLYKCVQNDCSEYSLTTCLTNMNCDSCQSGNNISYKMTSCKNGWTGATCTDAQVCSGDYQTTCSAGYHQNTSENCQSGNQVLYKCVINDCSSFTISGSCPSNAQGCTSCQSGSNTFFKVTQCKNGWNGTDCTNANQCSYSTTSCGNGYEETGETCWSAEVQYKKCQVKDCSAYSLDCGEGYNKVEACLSGTTQYYSCVPKSCGSGYIPGTTCGAGYEAEGEICQSGNNSYIKCVEAACTGYAQSCSSGYHEKVGDSCLSGSRTLVKCEENDCSSYSLSTCDDTHMNCNSCVTPSGTTYQKASCKEGWEGTDCMTPASCSGYSSSCGEGYSEVSGDTCKSGTNTLKKCTENACEGYTVGTCPENAEGCQTCLRGATNTYQFTQCKDGWQGETCSEEKSCSGYPLEECPTNAKCEESCRSGNSDKLKITSCTKTNYVVANDGLSCVIHCTENTYASGENCLSCPTGATSPENSSSINDCDCGSGYKLEGNSCVQVDFVNLDKHPGSVKTATDYASENEFINGNFLNQINAQYAYAHGYNGYVTSTAADGTVSLSDNKIKVGVIDNYLDVSNPDLTANIKTATINGTTKAAGINFDYGPCRLHDGVRDTTHCYGLKVQKTQDDTEYGDLVFYKTGENDYETIDAGSNSKGWYTQTWIDSSYFSGYSSDYDWDSDSIKYNVATTSNSEFSSVSNTSKQDHGTHVSGIIAALNNSSGMQGVVPNAEILFTQALAVVKGDYFDGKWFESAMQNYADSGVKVINMSIGGDGLASQATGKDASSVYAKYEVEAMKIAAQNGIVTVHSAGNDGNNKEAELDSAYPLTTTFSSGSYDLTKLNISVAAVDKNDKLASYSQICGATKGFCISAPGGDGDRGWTLFKQSSEYITRNNTLEEQESALDSYYAAYENATTDEERQAAATEYNARVTEYNTAVTEFNNWLSTEKKNVYKEWDIYSTVKTDGSHTKESNGSAYGYMQGTSMAAPVVTGSVALLMSAYPYLSSKQIVEILFRSANKDLVGWGTSLYNEVDDITVTDSLSTWTDSFNNTYNISSIYGHGEVDLEAATQPLGSVNVPVDGIQNKQSIVNTKLALPLVLNSKIIASVPQSVMGLDDYNRPFRQSISGLVYRAKHNSDTFKRDFRSFINPKKISTAGVQDKLSFEFSSSQTDQNLLGMGSLDMMYQFNDTNKMKFSYRSDVLAEKSLSEKVVANPFMDMTDSYALGHEFKLNSKLGFGFTAMTGKNGFYETDEDLDDEFKKSMQAFDMSVVYKPVSKVSFKAVGGLLKEKESVLGMNGSGLFETENSSTYYTGAILEYKPSIPFTLSAAYYYGQSKMPKTSGLVQFDDITSDSFAFEAKYQPNETNVLGFQFMSPLRIRKGSAIFNLPVARDLYSDTIYYDKTKVSLKPNARELDLGMYYLSQSDELDWRTELMMRLHPDHVSEAKPDYRALFGLSWKY